MLHGEVGPAIDDDVAIMARRRAEAGMEALVHFLRAQDRDRVRAHMIVQRVGHLVGRPGDLKVDMGDLAKRVNPGIGAPGGMRGDRRIVEHGGGLLQHLLHRGRIGLALPALERAAVILDIETVTRHAASGGGSPAKARG